MEFAAKKREELKPCPFCGGEVDCMDTAHKDLSHRLHAFLCKNCGAQIYLPASGKYQSADVTEAEAVELFNRRPAPENKLLTVEQLRQMDGEPVYVIYIRREWNSWMLSSDAQDYVDEVLRTGATAYARKPGQEEQNDKR